MCLPSRICKCLFAIKRTGFFHILTFSTPSEIVSTVRLSDFFTSTYAFLYCSHLKIGKYSFNNWPYHKSEKYWIDISYRNIYRYLPCIVRFVSKPALTGLDFQISQVSICFKTIQPRMYYWLVDWISFSTLDLWW